MNLAPRPGLLLDATFSSGVSSEKWRDPPENEDWDPRPGALLGFLLAGRFWSLSSERALGNGPGFQRLFLSGFKICSARLEARPSKVIFQCKFGTPHLTLPTRSWDWFGDDTVDGRNPAPPEKPRNHDSLVNTNRQWFPIVSKWCEMDFVHPQSPLLVEAS